MRVRGSWGRVGVAVVVAAVCLFAGVTQAQGGLSLKSLKLDSLKPAQNAQQSDDLVASLQKVIDGTLETVEKVPSEAAALLRGDQEALATVSNLLCPPTRALEELLEQHLGIAAGLTAIVCSAGLLEFEFQTTWTAPDGGTIKRTTAAIVGVPAQLNVDADAAPDLAGTLSLGSNLDTLAMTVERASGETSDLPVAVEAVLTDSSRQLLGREHLAFGYDARGDRAPDRLELSTPLNTLLAATGQYRFDLTQQGRGEEIALTGALFDGPSSNRVDPTEVRLDYGASPDNASVTARLTDGVSATLTTNRPGPAELSGLVASEGVEQTAAVEIRDLPNELTLDVEPESGAITYNASADVERLAARVNTGEPFFLDASDFKATLLEVPQSFELSLGQEASNLELTSDQPIGQLDLQGRSENRPFPEIPDGEAGATVHSAADEFGLALRTFRLRDLAVSLDPIELTARMQGGRVFTVDAEIEQEEGPLSVDAVLDPLPAEVSLAVDSETGQISYSGSTPMDRLTADVSTPEPVLLGAQHFGAELLDVPESFALSAGQDAGNIGLTSDQPIGQLDLRGRSDNRAFPSIPAGEAGALLDATGGELALALRTFGLRELGISLEPLEIRSQMEAGRTFTIDATLDQEDEDGNPIAPVDADVLIDEMPAELRVALDDLQPQPDGPGGSALRLEGSDPIDFLSLAVEGLELLEGASSVKAAIDDVPTELAVELPEEGPLAAIDANDHIGQLRLAAAAGDAQLPARSLLPGDPVLNDLFRFKNLADEFGIGLRLSAMRGLSVNLDPVQLALEQNAAQTRPIDLDAGFAVDEDEVLVDGLLDKPGSSTSMSVDLTPGSPARLIFDNSHNMNRFELGATGLSGIDSVDLAFDNLSRRMSICMEPGPGCQRPNPNGTQRYGGANATVASLDFDDHGTHGSGSGPAFRTTLNASIAFDSGDPITITNLRFRNLGFDFADSNNNHSSNCGTIPRISLFFDSRGHPFVINSLKYPPSIQDFRIGSDSNPARARTRIARLNGWSGGVFGCLGGLSTSSGGGLSCGGQNVLRVDTPLGNINILDFLGFQLLPVCGGSVSNPQPW